MVGGRQWQREMHPVRRQPLLIRRLEFSALRSRFPIAMEMETAMLPAAETRNGRSSTRPRAGARISVYYDGDCPICRYEVALYSRRDHSGRVDWVDIERLADSELPAGKTRDELLGRFHVLDRAGAWFIGVDAMARIWRELPRLRRFAWTVDTPVLRQIAQMAYRLFLMWQRWDRRRRKRLSGA